MNKIYFFLGDAKSRGGIERVVFTLADALSENIKVKICSLYSGDKDNDFNVNGNVNVEFISKKNEVSMFNRQMNFVSGLFFDLFYILKKLNPVRKKLITEKPDFVVSSDIKMTLLLYIATINTHIKIIAIEHFEYDVPNSILKIVRKILYKLLFRVVTLTNEDYAKYSWLEKDKLYVIPNIVNSNNDNNISYERRDKKVILAVGRLTHQKGFDLLIEAWSLISQRHFDWELKIYGDGEDEELLKQILIDLGTGNVKIYPFNNDIDNVYRQSDIFVLSSRYEGLGMVLLEAMSHRLPCISFDCPAGPKTIIDHNENGLLVESGNVQSLAESISHLIEDEELRHKFVSNAHLVLENYSADTVRLKWLKMLNCNVGFEL